MENTSYRNTIICRNKMFVFRIPFEFETTGAEILQKFNRNKENSMVSTLSFTNSHLLTKVLGYYT